MGAARAANSRRQSHGCSGNDLRLRGRSRAIRGVTSRLPNSLAASDGNRVAGTLVRFAPVSGGPLEGTGAMNKESVMDESSQAAGILLKLYELRTEPTLRQARAWFVFEFHPSTAQDVLAA